MLSAPPDLAQLALETAPDAMIIIDAGGIIRFANRQVTTIFGYAHDEVVGQSVEVLMPGRFRERHVVHRREYASNVRVRSMGQGLALYGLRHDGSEFPVEVSLSPLEGRDPPLVAAAIRDASESKRIQSELIAARAAAETAREVADRANQAKSRFLATASHDLRQPLQTLALLNGTLRRMIRDTDAARTLAQQDQAITAMSRLLNALLDISKLESGAVKPEPEDFAVAMLFEELRQEFASVAAGKGLRLDIEPSPARVHSDPSLIEQVLRNLVSNAIKYTQRGRVALRCLLVPESMVRLEVLDTGIGISASELGSIYDEFYQVNVPPNTSREGYGLGLSIVKRIVELLGIELEVRSQPGEGSAFALILPSARGVLAPSNLELDPPQAYSAPRTRHGAPRLLLVEDHPAVRTATALLLQVEGYVVTAVGSLEEVLVAARDGTGFDLLVTDFHLSDGHTGIDVIKSLREALGGPVKSILVTGDTSLAIRQLPRDPNLCVASKPIKAEELLSLIRGLIPEDTRAPA